MRRISELKPAPVTVRVEHEGDEYELAFSPITAAEAVRIEASDGGIARVVEMLCGHAICDDDREALPHLPAGLVMGILSQLTVSAFEDSEGKFSITRG